MRRTLQLPLTVTLALALSSGAVLAQSAPPAGQGQGTPAPAPPSSDDPAVRLQLPTVTVTALKEPADLQTIPVSVTAVSAETIERAGIRIVSDATLFAPNAYFTDFSARKLSNARFRGIGASPGNPAVTTYVDGVPQINSNTASLDLLDVEQIEFVRGAQSALFGRNALGGLINVTSARPARDRWTGDFSVPFGNHGAWDLRGSASGPVVADKLSVGVALRQAEREGFTVNPLTGNDLDYRSAFSAKGQIHWTPGSEWEARVIVSGERARDGDYALNDLAALRQRPYESARDFEGLTNRDVFGTTIQARRTGESFTLTSTTGFVNWSTSDLTDLDYSPVPLIERRNDEDDLLFTQEVRVASREPAALNIASGASIRWQAGVFLFTQNYEQEAVNSLQPALTQAPLTLEQYSPVADLDDFGLGFFGQGTMTLGQRLDLIAGARVDYENKNATLSTFTVPALPLAPSTSVVAEESFSNVSPQLAVAYRLESDRSIYASLGRGYKAGGFNPSSPAGSEAYDEEHTWHLEGGLKSRWANGRVSANAAVFYIDWNDLQLNVPDPFVPAQFYIANVGGAVSRGFELELNARPLVGVDLFGAFGYTNARFDDGSRSSGVDVGGNELPNTPDYTASAGVQYSAAIRQMASWYARADLAFYGAFKYDDANLEGQEAYSVVNLRGGIRGRLLRGEIWMRNAFDTTYIPVAFAFPGLAPSGFLGENGAPRTFGISVGVGF
ncbi:MAG TPA: TonB-dependent receptor [Vicinamibacterales bacterium]|nr:TonB-dependent receptor [Vicinamibacterales bacterium]